MRLNLEDLRLRGGQRHVRDVAVEVAPVGVGGAEYQVILPDGVTVTVERIAGGYLLALKARATICGPCSRCLAEVCREVEAEQQEFIPAVLGGWAETQSETTPFVDDLVVDVTALVREAVVLAMPGRILCKEGCKGLCPECGTDLNVSSCSCSTLEE